MFRETGEHHRIEGDLALFSDAVQVIHLFTAFVLKIDELERVVESGAQTGRYLQASRRFLFGVLNNGECLPCFTELIGDMRKVDCQGIGLVQGGGEFAPGRIQWCVEIGGLMGQRQETKQIKQGQGQPHQGQETATF